MGKKLGDEKRIELIMLFNKFLKNHIGEEKYIVDEDGERISAKKILEIFLYEYKDECVALGHKELSLNFIFNNINTLHMISKNRKWKYSTADKNIISTDVEKDLRENLKSCYRADVFVLHLEPNENGRYHEIKVVSALRKVLGISATDMDYQKLKDGRLILYIKQSTHNKTVVNDIKKYIEK